MNSEEKIDEQCSTFSGPSFNIRRDAVFFLFLFFLSLFMAWLLIFLNFPLLVVFLWLLLYGFSEILLFLMVIRTYKRCLSGELKDGAFGIKCEEKAYKIEIKICNEELIYIKKSQGEENKKMLKFEEMREIKIKYRAIFYLPQGSEASWQSLGKVPAISRKDLQKLKDKIREKVEKYL